MLYDPKWNLISVRGLIAWLETQDPNEEYNWACERCLIGRYLEAIGQFDKMKDGITYSILTTKECIAIKQPHTFGTALERARKAIDAPPFGKISQ